MMSVPISAAQQYMPAMEDVSNATIQQPFLEVPRMMENQREDEPQLAVVNGSGGRYENGNPSGEVESLASVHKKDVTNGDVIDENSLPVERGHQHMPQQHSSYLESGRAAKAIPNALATLVGKRPPGRPRIYARQAVLSTGVSRGKVGRPRVYMRNPRRRTRGGGGRGGGGLLSNHYHHSNNYQHQIVNNNNNQNTNKNCTQGAAGRLVPTRKAAIVIKPEGSGQSGAQIEFTMSTDETESCEGHQEGRSQSEQQNGDVSTFVNSDVMYQRSSQEIPIPTPPSQFDLQNAPNAQPQSSHDVLDRKQQEQQQQNLAPELAQLLQKIQQLQSYKSEQQQQGLSRCAAVQQQQQQQQQLLLGKHQQAQDKLSTFEANTVGSLIPLIVPGNDLITVDNSFRGTTVSNTVCGNGGVVLPGVKTGTCADSAPSNPKITTTTTTYPTNRTSTTIALPSTSTSTTTSSTTTSSPLQFTVLQGVHLLASERTQIINSNELQQVSSRSTSTPLAAATSSSSTSSSSPPRNGSVMPPLIQVTSMERGGSVPVNTSCSSSTPITNDTQRTSISTNSLPTSAGRYASANPQGLGGGLIRPKISDIGSSQFRNSPGRKGPPPPLHRPTVFNNNQEKLRLAYDQIATMPSMSQVNLFTMAPEPRPPMVFKRPHALPFKVSSNNGQQQLPTNPSDRMALKGQGRLPSCVNTNNQRPEIIPGNPATHLPIYQSGVEKAMAELSAIKEEALLKEKELFSLWQKAKDLVTALLKITTFDQNVGGGANGNAQQQYEKHRQWRRDDSIRNVIINPEGEGTNGLSCTCNSESCHLNTGSQRYQTTNGITNVHGDASSSHYHHSEYTHSNLTNDHKQLRDTDNNTAVNMDISQDLPTDYSCHSSRKRGHEQGNTGPYNNNNNNADNVQNTSSVMDSQTRKQPCGKLEQDLSASGVFDDVILETMKENEHLSATSMQLENDIASAIYGGSKGKGKSISSLNGKRNSLEAMGKGSGNGSPLVLGGGSSRLSTDRARSTSMDELIQKLVNTVDNISGPGIRPGRAGAGGRVGGADSLVGSTGGANIIPMLNSSMPIHPGFPNHLLKHNSLPPNSMASTEVASLRPRSPLSSALSQKIRNMNARIASAPPSSPSPSNIPSSSASNMIPPVAEKFRIAGHQHHPYKMDARNRASPLKGAGLSSIPPPSPPPSRAALSVEGGEVQGALTRRQSTSPLSVKERISSPPVHNSPTTQNGPANSPKVPTPPTIDPVGGPPLDGERVTAAPAPSTTPVSSSQVPSAPNTLSVRSSPSPSQTPPSPTNYPAITTPPTLPSPPVSALPTSVPPSPVPSPTASTPMTVIPSNNVTSPPSTPTSPLTLPRPTTTAPTTTAPTTTTPTTDPTTDPMPGSTTTGPTTTQTPRAEICELCEGPASFVCSSCIKVWYCSIQCQVKAWERHKKRCFDQLVYKSSTAGQVQTVSQQVVHA